MRVTARALTLAAVVVAAACRADDGDLLSGGTPQLMYGKTRVRMVSERVTIRTQYKSIHVNCVFLFHNSGKACTVRMGFPDLVEPGDSFEDAKGPPVALGNFRSWVNGQVVRTAPIKGKDDMTWHVKSVHFGANQTLVVKDTYSMHLSGGATNSQGAGKASEWYAWDLPYILSTGGSWNGTIGDAVVEVDLPFKVRTATREPDSFQYSEYDKWGTVHPGQVLYMGFGTATIHGKRMVFHRKNFKPDGSSDIHIYWPVYHLEDMIGETYDGKLVPGK